MYSEKMKTFSKPLFLTAVLVALICIVVVARYVDLSVYNFRIPSVLGLSDSSTEEVVEEPKPNPNEEMSIFAQELEPIYSIPENIKILGTNIDLPIVKLGLEEDGQLQNPSDWQTAGWYSKSSKPFEPGNIIINAHYDNNYGGPAGFWELKNVVIGDTVLIKDAHGKIYKYQVTNSFYLDINDPNRLEIFESKESIKELTLITCGGIWDFTHGTYNKRLVVKAELFE